MVKNLFQLQKKETEELLIYFIFSKFCNEPKNVSRHCGVHYNRIIKHFDDFSRGERLFKPPSHEKLQIYTSESYFTHEYEPRDKL